MKKILIFREKGAPIELFDNDDTQINEYTRKLTSSLKSTNVIILETSENHLILRPHKVDAIKVFEIDNNDVFLDEDEKITQLMDEDEQHIDIITDGE